MNIPPDLATLILTLLGGSGGLGYLIKAFLDYRSGLAEKEKAVNKDIISSLNDTQEKLESEIAYRHEWQEYASILRAMLIETGVYAKSLPKKPYRKKETDG